MQDLMFAEEPVEKREQLLRDNCDQLVSPGAKEVADEYRDRCIDDVVGKIREIAPDIAIMEA